MAAMPAGIESCRKPAVRVKTSTWYAAGGVLGPDGSSAGAAAPVQLAASAPTQLATTASRPARLTLGRRLRHDFPEVVRMACDVHTSM